MKSRTLKALLIVMILVTSILVGCGQSKETDNKKVTEDTKVGNKKEDTKTDSKKNVTIRFLAANHAWLDAIKPEIANFTAETGIKVQLESFTEEQLSNKLAVESTAGSETLDVFMIRPLQEGLTFERNGWLALLDDYSTSDQEYDIDDYVESALKSLTFNDKVYGIPLVTEREIIYYRKDIFDQYNIKVPETLDELEEAAKKINEESDISGFVARGQRSAAVTQFSGYLRSMGGDFIVDGQAAIDTPEAIAAFEFYGRLLKNYGPTGVLNMSWPQAAAVFSQGQAAMYTDADSLYKVLIDPEKSTVADKIGFAVFPKGPNGAKPYNVCTWGLGIGVNSKNKDAAWEFISWITNKENTLKAQAQGVPLARISVWEKPEGVKGFPAELVEVINKSNQIGVDTDRPRMFNVQEARDIIGMAIIAAIEGDDVAKVAKSANSDFQKLLDKEK